MQVIKHLHPACAMAATTFMLAAGMAVADETAVLQITVVGIEEFEGDIVIAVFDSEDSFDKRENPVASGTIPADSVTISWSSELESPAVYAVAVYHDLNQNRQLDTRRMGIPKEPYGFSNNARDVFGPPGFDEAKFVVELDRHEVEIEVR